MHFEPLDRPTDHYRWVLKTWLTTPTLTLNESTLVRTLLDGLEKSIADFDQLRKIAVQPAFINTLQSAARKAMAAGLLTDWDQYAEST